MLSATQARLLTETITSLYLVAYYARNEARCYDSAYGKEFQRVCALMFYEPQLPRK